MTKFTIGQCIERNGVPQLAGQIYDIDDTNYHIHRFGRQGLPGYEFHYGITDTENLFHEVQCIDPTHKWETPRPLPDASAPAQGRLESLTYPASVEHGADVRVGFKIHNTGGSTGTFIARLYKGVLHAGTDWRAVVHAGDSPSGAITVKAPTTGDHVYYTLALFLET